jgi:hypothetical protein
MRCAPTDSLERAWVLPLDLPLHEEGMPVERERTAACTVCINLGFRIVDVFGAFGGIATPNICTYNWICAVGDIHPTDLGYSVIADTFAAAVPED